MIKIKINNQEYSINSSKTILEVCYELGIKIPTLCYLKGINEEASCRMCVVELKGVNNLVPACSTKITSEMEIFTNSIKVINARRRTLELILANHRKECLTCAKNGHCTLEELAEVYQVDLHDYRNPNYEVLIDDHNHAVARDNSKCILCNRCVNFCKNIQGVEAIKRINRGEKTYIGSLSGTLDKTNCVYCGGCVSVCPTGALMEKSGLEKVYEALHNPDLEVVACYAPSVRVTLGEEFGYKMGENVSSKLNTALRLMGFKEVFDITYGADLTVLEEATELIERIKKKENLPLMTSCCPAWVNYVKNFYPEYLPYLSSTKSPQGIFGSVCKTYYNDQRKDKRKKLFIVSIMPCIAKKDEIEKRDNATKEKDVDVVLTVRELAKMIRLGGIDLKTISGSDFSPLIGKGNSIIFGSSGGVMETALRYAKEKLEGKGGKNLVFEEVRGIKGVKEAEYIINKQKIKVLIVSSLSKIKPFLESGEIKNYHFVEVMACPGGCINGAGNPSLDSLTRSFVNYQQKRSNGLYGIEKTYKSNKAKDNVLVKNIYKEYLGEAGSVKAHKILHTKFY